MGEFERWYCQSDLASQVKFAATMSYVETHLAAMSTWRWGLKKVEQLSVFTFPWPPMGKRPNGFWVIYILYFVKYWYVVLSDLLGYMLPWLYQPGKDHSEIRSDKIIVSGFISGTDRRTGVRQSTPFCHVEAL